MAQANLQDPPSVKTALQIDTDQEIADIMARAQEKSSVWKKIGPYLTGFVSFLLGLVLFLPLDDLAIEILSKTDLGEGAPQFSSFSISTLGSLDIKSFLLKLPSFTNDAQEASKNQFKAASIEGDVSLISFLLFDDLESRLSLNNFEIDLASNLSLTLRGEKINLIFEGKDFEAEGKKKCHDRQGSTQRCQFDRQLR